MVKRKAKKYKPSKEAKIIYDNMLKTVFSSQDVLSKKQKSSEFLYELKQATDRINQLRERYNYIVNNVKSPETIADDMPISSLRDSIEYELSGKVSKIQYEDILEASDIKKEGQAIIDSNVDLLNRAKIAEIEFLQSTIEQILKASEKNAV